MSCQCQEGGYCMGRATPGCRQTSGLDVVSDPAPATHDPAYVPNSTMKITLTSEQIDCLREGGTVHGRDAKWWGVGMRFTKGKPPVWQGFINYFPLAIRAVSDVSAFGATKYDWNNWQQLENGYTNCTNSLGRHLTNESVKGPLSLDDESNLLEAAHSAWNAMARLEFLLREQKENPNVGA